MDINRKTAYEVLFAVESKKQYSNIALNNYIKNENPDSQGFVRELVYGVLENKLLIDYYISKFIKGRIKDVRRQDLIILRMGIYQIKFMDSVPNYAAVDECVKLAKKFARGRDKFINGVLRSFLREGEKILLPDKNEDPVKYLSIKYSYEKWIVEMWLKSYELDFVEKLLMEGNKRPPVTVRANMLKGDRKSCSEMLKAKGFEVENCSLASMGIHVKGERLLDSEMYKNGYFSVQDEASQMVSSWLEAEEGDIVVDVCAAPGGKSLSVAESMKNTGTVISQDIYEKKVLGISNEAKRLGILNLQVRTWDATKLRDDLVGKCHRVIADVPCSGLGVLRRKPEIKYNKNFDEVNNLPKLQLEILETASKYLKSGGRMVYSTCTINSAENEGVVKAFIDKNSQFQVVKSHQFLPNVDNTDGFYICVLKREDVV